MLFWSVTPLTCVLSVSRSVSSSEYGRPVGPTWSWCLSWSVPPLTCVLSMSRRSLSSSWAWRTTTAGNPAWAATVMMHILMRESHSKHVLRFVRKNVFTICNRKKFQSNWSNKPMSTFAATQMLLWHSTWWRNNPHWRSHERDLNKNTRQTYQAGQKLTRNNFWWPLTLAILKVALTAVKNQT